MRNEKGQFVKGHKTWNKGKRGLQGPNSGHSWVSRKLGKPESCEECGKSKLTGRKIHWANISGDYKRDSEDWKRLCVPCHKRFDLTKCKSIL